MYNDYGSESLYIVHNTKRSFFKQKKMISTVFGEEPLLF